MVLRQARHGAIVKNSAALVTNNSVTDAPRLKRRKPMGVDLVEKTCRVSALYDKLPKSAHVDQTRMVTHGVVLFLNRRVNAGSFPHPHVHHLVGESRMFVMDAAELHRMELLSSQGSQRDRNERRS